MNYMCVMFNYDDNGNEVDHLLIESERPEKVYPDGSCDEYGDKRDGWRTLKDPQPKPLTKQELYFQKFSQ